MVHPSSPSLREAAAYDVFLSYRVDADQALVESLHDKLKAQDNSLRVFWDKVALPLGISWEAGFVHGLCTSKVFVPVISSGTLRKCEVLTSSSPCDNVLLEYLLALELRDRGCVKRIFPVLVGDLMEQKGLGGVYGDFFRGPFEKPPFGNPTAGKKRFGATDLPSTEVEALMDKFDSHLNALEHAGKITASIGHDQVNAVRFNAGVSSIVDGITRNQGCFLKGIKADGIDQVVRHILMCISASLQPL